MELNRNTVTSKSILCDIEGTTSSIDFVKETLFPYALKNVEKFLQENWDRDDVKESVIELRKLAEKDTEEKVDGAVPVLGEDEEKSKIIESVVKNVEWLMGNDRKVTPLKTLQGLIWESGWINQGPETLFPYALKNVEKFLQENWDRDDVKESVIELRKLAEKDTEEKVDGAVPILGEDKEKSKIIESVVKNVEWLMGNDRKVTPLKTLQGLIWESGYKDGSIKGHIYDDVPKSFENWTKTGHKIYIYSSGSVMAQKLLFGNTSAGDLQVHLSGYFDTKIGPKQEKESYEAIAKNIECAANEIVFLTDIVKEAKAAQEAGMNVVIVVRPGNAPLTDEDKKEFPTVESFEGITLEEVVTGKRKILDEEVEDKQESTKPAKLAKLEMNDAPDKNEEVTEKIDKTDDEPKCDTTAEEKNETDRTDAAAAKTDKETEPKNDEDEKMETEQAEEIITEETKKESDDVKAVEEEPVGEEKDLAVEETKKAVSVVADEIKEDIVEKMEVDGEEKVAAASPSGEIITEAKDVEAEADKKVTEAEPKVIEEKVDEKETGTESVEVKADSCSKDATDMPTVDEIVAEIPATDSTKKEDNVKTPANSNDEISDTVQENTIPKEAKLDETCSNDATDTTNVNVEKKKEEEVINGKVEEKPTEEVTEELAVTKDAPEEVKVITEETAVDDKKNVKELDGEKATGSINGDALDAVGTTSDGVNGDKGDKGIKEEEKAENGKDGEIKNGHNENAEKEATVSEPADGEKDAAPDASTGSDQVSEVIVKKCVEPMVKSPVPQPVEAES
uniref:Enolase-phosphatase E1 n=1 Tax=Lutzomyia longipalpis TaxID=7200 RepID=A0A7G3AHC3_LUTLO